MGGWAFYWLNNCSYQLNYLVHMFPVAAGARCDRARSGLRLLRSRTLPRAARQRLQG